MPIVSDPRLAAIAARATGRPEGHVFEAVSRSTFKGTMDVVSWHLEAPDGARAILVVEDSLRVSAWDTTGGMPGLNQPPDLVAPLDEGVELPREHPAAFDHLADLGGHMRILLDDESLAAGLVELLDDGVIEAIDKAVTLIEGVLSKGGVALADFPPGLPMHVENDMEVHDVQEKVAAHLNELFAEGRSEALAAACLLVPRLGGAQALLFSTAARAVRESRAAEQPVLD